jgi:FemAB-related protein (PEP-CTERM system-associated)
VDSAPDATVCHLSGWLQSLERTWHHRSHALVAADGTLVRGVLPLVHMRSRLFGSMLVSTPTAIYGGALAPDPGDRRALVAEARRLATELKVDYLELRDHRPREITLDDVGFQRQDLYVTFDRPLLADPDQLLASFPKKIRYQVRRAHAHGLTVQTGGAELLDGFYDVYAANMRHLGTPVYPKRWFAELLSAFRARCDILLVHCGQRIAGATLNFYFRDTVLPHYGCAMPPLLDTGVSAFMYVELMTRAAARGCTQFDFGRSKMGSGSWAFKRGWRMRERTLPYRVLLVRAARMPNLNPTNPRFKMAIRLWRRLPLPVTRILGPAVVRSIP